MTASSNPNTKIGAIVLSVIGLAALLAPLIVPADGSLSPFALNLSLTNAPPGTGQHVLGTDNLGRDVFALLLWGARTSLLIGLCSAACAVTLGSIWGAVSAFIGGATEAIMMRLVDVLLAIPNLILLLVIDALVADLPFQQILPPLLHKLLGITNYSNGLLPLLTVVIVISATTWLELSRLVCAQVKVLMAKEYVDAAITSGLGSWQIIVRHLLPNARNIILVEGALIVADAILSEAGLSFLGLGLGPSMPSWGTMLNSAQQSLLLGNWWTVLAPGIAITLTVIAVQLLSQKQRERVGSLISKPVE